MMVNKSVSITELARALSRCQGELRPVKKDAENPFFRKKYAGLAAIWESCRQPLTGNGLSVTQLIRLENEKRILETVLLHNSGEWISSDYPILAVKEDPQGVGSALTYARRYALSAILGIVAEDEDDDAESASGRVAGVNPRAHSKTQPAQEVPAEVDGLRARFTAVMARLGLKKVGEVNKWIEDNFGASNWDGLTLDAQEMAIKMAEETPPE